ncbi:hypothetical protein EIP86_008693 [Pleurotus ostreatoroseus]|nr:hypothetical protein EIP86_008693 [Pleurotus ostreatoroseus]
MLNPILGTFAWLDLVENALADREQGVTDSLSLFARVAAERVTTRFPDLADSAAALQLEFGMPPEDTARSSADAPDNPR